MGDEVTSKAVAVKAFISKRDLSNITIWEADSALKLQGFIRLYGDLDLCFCCINVKLLSQGIGYLCEGLIIPEMNWDACDSYPEGDSVREVFSGKGFPTFQGEAPLVEMTWSFV